MICNDVKVVFIINYDIYIIIYIKRYYIMQGFRKEKRKKKQGFKNKLFINFW